MDAVNRIGEIKKLRTNACQDFLSLIIQNGWQNQLYKIAESAVKNNVNKLSYSGIYNQMRNYGITNYSVYDMDITAINTIITYNNHLIIPISNKTKDEFNIIKEDKNITSHASDNEEPEKLFYEELRFIRHLRNFIIAVDDNESLSITDSDRLQFRKKYIKLIDDKESALEQDLFILTQPKQKRKNDIEYILNSENPSQAWLDMQDEYYRKVQQGRIEYTEVFEFIKEAAESGIEFAYEQAAAIFYSDQEYEKAEKYLLIFYRDRNSRCRTTTNMMKLANIYINIMKSKAQEGYDIINELIDSGCNIVKTADGKRYELLMDGVCVQYIDIPQTEQ